MSVKRIAERARVSEEHLKELTTVMTATVRRHKPRNHEAPGILRILAACNWTEAEFRTELETGEFDY